MFTYLVVFEPDPYEDFGYEYSSGLVEGDSYGEAIKALEDKFLRKIQTIWVKECAEDKVYDWSEVYKTLRNDKNFKFEINPTDT